VKQHLAALPMLFDWLVTGRVLDVNPVHAVRRAPPSFTTEGRMKFRSTKWSGS